MTIMATAWAWEQELPPLDKLMLLAFADGGDRGSGAPVPIEQVAERCGISVDQAHQRWSALIIYGHVDHEGYVLHSTPDVTPARRGQRPTGHIYVLHDRAGARIKIGWTGGQITTRKQAIENAAGVRLQLVARFPGGRSVEQDLHARFDDARLRGEWFAVTDDIHEWLTELVS